MHEGSSLHDYLAILRRREVARTPRGRRRARRRHRALVAAAPKYQASAEVLLSRQNLGPLLNNVNDQSLRRPGAARADAGRPRAGSQVASRDPRPRRDQEPDPGRVPGNSSVSAKSDADLLVFTVTDRHPSLAARLATAVCARVHRLPGRARHRRAHARAQGVPRADRRARGIGRHQVGPLREPRRQGAAAATMEALQTSNASLVKPAQGATQDAAATGSERRLGLALGLLLGSGLAFLREALDTRVRTRRRASHGGSACRSSRRSRRRRGRSAARAGWRCSTSRRRSTPSRSASSGRISTREPRPARRRRSW